MSNPLTRLKSAKYVKALSQEKIMIDSNQLYMKKGFTLITFFI